MSQRGDGQQQADDRAEEDSILPHRGYLHWCFPTVVTASGIEPRHPRCAGRYRLRQTLQVRSARVFRPRGVGTDRISVECSAITRARRAVYVALVVPPAAYEMIVTADAPAGLPETVAEVAPAASSALGPIASEPAKKKPLSRVRAGDKRSVKSLEETLEILGASDLEIDNGRGELLNDSGIRHLRVEHVAQKNSPFSRLLERLTERVKKA